MIVLRIVKFFRRQNFSFNFLESLLSEQFLVNFFGFEGYFFLILAVVVYAGPVLCPLIIALSVQLCWVVIVQKYLENTAKFLDFRTQETFCNSPETRTKRPNFRVFRQSDENGIANSKDPDQSDLGLHCLARPICPNI